MLVIVIILLVLTYIDNDWLLGSTTWSLAFYIEDLALLTVRNDVTYGFLDDVGTLSKTRLT